MFLKAGVMTHGGTFEGSLTGTPQGGILSPLLSNIALSALDEHYDNQWRETMGTWHQRNRRHRQGHGSWRIIRYADDFVLVVNGTRQHADALRADVAGVIAPLGLRLAPDKTRVVHIDDGFDFLGFTIRRMRKRGTSKSYVYTVPSAKAIAAIIEKVRSRTTRSTLHLDLSDLLAGLNRTLQGWANYFRHGVSKRVFAKLDYHAWRRVGAWLRRKHGLISWREVRRRFCDIGWRFAQVGIHFRGATSVTVERYRFRGNKIPSPWTTTPVAVAG